MIITTVKDVSNGVKEACSPEENFQREPDTFGGNCFSENKEAISYFRKLVKLGCKLEFTDYETVRVFLSEGAQNTQKALIYIITTAPTPTNASYNSNKNVLTLVWS